MYQEIEDMEQDKENQELPNVGVGEYCVIE